MVFVCFLFNIFYFFSFFWYEYRYRLRVRCTLYLQRFFVFSLVGTYLFIFFFEKKQQNFNYMRSENMIFSGCCWYVWLMCVFCIVWLKVYFSMFFLLLIIWVLSYLQKQCLRCCYCENWLRTLLLSHSYSFQFFAGFCSRFNIFFVHAVCFNRPSLSTMCMSMYEKEKTKPNIIVSNVQHWISVKKWLASQFTIVVSKRWEWRGDDFPLLLPAIFLGAFFSFTYSKMRCE